MSDEREARIVSLWDVETMLTFSAVRDMHVDHVSPTDVDEFCHRWHYTAHKGAASWRYGLWDGEYLVGIVAYLSLIHI